jgi:membrane-associated phospholipid phosphatase
MNSRRPNLYPYDYLIIGYCLIMVAFCVTFGRPFTAYLDEIIFYLCVAGIAALITRYIDPSRSRVLLFVRLLYPLALFTSFYRITGGTMFLIYDRFFDAHIVAFETGLFGMEPTLYIDRYLLHPFWNELFSACYFSYYLMIPGFLLPIFFLNKTRVIKESLTAICLTFFMSFLIFFLYPIEGPRWHLAGQYTHSIDGPFFRHLVTTVINNAAVRGGCMPSSHVGVGLVILTYAFRMSRKLGWILLPLNIGLAIGTFWGRFHYVSDVVVGAAIAFLCVWLVMKFYDRFDPPIVTTKTVPLVSKTHAA